MSPDGEKVSLNAYPHYVSAWRMIRICGDNRKRGIMCWANRIYPVRPGAVTALPR